MVMTDASHMVALTNRMSRVDMLPAVGVSVNAPPMLANAPQLRTYINAYDSKHATMKAIVDKLLAGPEAFTAKDPIDSFCGLWDAKI